VIVRVKSRSAQIADTENNTHSYWLSAVSV